MGCHFYYLFCHSISDGVLRGWKLFESGDPILIELGVSLVLSFFVFVFNEVVTGLEKRVRTLEERLEKYENLTR